MLADARHAPKHMNAESLMPRDWREIIAAAVAVPAPSRNATFAQAGVAVSDSGFGGSKLHGRQPIVVASAKAVPVRNAKMTTFTQADVAVSDSSFRLGENTWQPAAPTHGGRQLHPRQFIDTSLGHLFHGGAKPLAEQPMVIDSSLGHLSHDASKSHAGQPAISTTMPAFTQADVAVGNSGFGGSRLHGKAAPVRYTTMPAFAHADGWQPITSAHGGVKVHARQTFGTRLGENQRTTIHDLGVAAVSLVSHTIHDLGSTTIPRASHTIHLLGIAAGSRVTHSIHALTSSAIHRANQIRLRTIAAMHRASHAMYTWLAPEPIDIVVARRMTCETARRLAGYGPAHAEYQAYRPMRVAVLSAATTCRLQSASQTSFYPSNTREVLT